MQYQLDMDAVMNDARNVVAPAQNENGDWQKTKYISLKDGTTTVRILPVPAGSEIQRSKPWWSTIKHWGFVGPGGKKMSSIVCGMEIHGKCPLCQYSENLYGIGDQESKDLGYSTRPQNRFAYTVLTDQGEIAIMELDEKAHSAILDMVKAYRNQDPNFNPYDLQSGRWFDIKKSKEKTSGGWRKFPRNVYAIAPHLQQTSVSQSILSNYAKLYVYPEKVNPTYTIEELGKITRGDWSFLGGKFVKNGASGDTSFNVAEFEATLPPDNNILERSVKGEAIPPPPSIRINSQPRPIPVAPIAQQKPTVQNNIDDELKNLIGDI